jgi:hypothetical protein
MTMMSRATYKMIGEFKARQVGVGILEIYNHKLFVLVCGQQQW